MERIILWQLSVWCGILATIGLMMIAVIQWSAGNWVQGTIFTLLPALLIIAGYKTVSQEWPGH